MNNTVVFTRSEVIKRARKLYRTGDWKDFINGEERKLFTEIDNLGTQFFRLAKQDPLPEKQFIILASAGSMLSDINKQPKTTQLACTLLTEAARYLCREKMSQLDEAVRS